MSKTEQDPPQHSTTENALADPQHWATIINAGVGRTVQALIDVGLSLLSAKEQLRHGEWERMFRGHAKAVEKPIRFSIRTAQRFMLAAKLSGKTTDLSCFPPALTVLEALAKLPDLSLEAAVKSRTINPDLKLKHVQKLRPCRDKGGWTRMKILGPERRAVPELIPGYTIDGFLEVARDIAENIQALGITQEGRIQLRAAAQNILDALDGGIPTMVGGEVVAAAGYPVPMALNSTTVSAR